MTHTTQLGVSPENRFRHLFKLCLSLSLPMASVRFIAMLNTFIGFLMVAQLGHRELAASALVSITSATISMAPIALLFSVSPAAGQAYGRKDHRQVAAVWQQSMILALLISLPCMVICWYIGDILRLFGQKPELIVFAVTYFHRIMWVMFPLLLIGICQQVISAVLEQWLAMWVSTANLCLSALLYYALILGHFGFPRMGMAGFGDGMVIRLVFAATAYVSLLGLKRFRSYPFFVWQAKQSAVLRSLFQIGWPISLQITGELLSYCVMMMMVGWLGMTQLGAFQIVDQYCLLLLVPVFGVAQAASILVGHGVGERSLSKVRLSGNIAVGLGIGVMLLCGIAFICFPEQLAWLYIHHHTDATTVHTLYFAGQLFFINAFVQMFDAIRNIYAGALRGLYDTRFPMFINLSFLWIFGVGIGYVVTFPLGYGLRGLFWADCVGIALSAGILHVRWRRKVAQYENIV